MIYTILHLIISIVALYFCYQLFRNLAIFSIRREWAVNNHKKWHKYECDFMYYPNKNNWYGLRYPRKKHFK